jgi:prepilin-type N-terminal cleavage/methylation domain-containing protein
VRGFTLVELMVALTIGLLMSFGLIRVFASSSESYQSLSQASQQIENGRYAMQAIGEDLKHAGYYGEYAFPPAAGRRAARSVRGRETWRTCALRLRFTSRRTAMSPASPVTCIDDCKCRCRNGRAW